MKIAIFGGTGDLGRGLAVNFAAAGHEIIVGSRSQERAEEVQVLGAVPRARIGECSGSLLSAGEGVGCA